MATTISNQRAGTSGKRDVQGARIDAFRQRHPLFSMDDQFTNYVFTLALIIKDTQVIDVTELDDFLAFVGNVYVPYLIKERDNDPLPPHALWHLVYRGLRSCSISANHRNSLMIACETSKMLEVYCGSSADLECKDFLMKNCQFLIGLCKKSTDPELYKAPIKNVELHFVLVDRTLEAKSRAPAPTKEVEIEMEDKLKKEFSNKVSEMIGSMEFKFEVVSSSEVKLVSNSLNQSNKKRKHAEE